MGASEPAMEPCLPDPLTLFLWLGASFLHPFGFFVRLYY
jgi:hypothetical protein